MATTYNTAFGSLPGYNEMLGTTNTTGGGQQNVYGQRAQSQRNTTTQGQAAPAQTFAQLQKQGLARPAQPTAPTAAGIAQYGGSTEAQQMRQRLQSQLQQFGEAPSRFDTQAFQQIRGAQAANLQAEYQAQQQQLNEELARRGLSASSIGGGRMGDLAGQQARALASLDAQLLQQAAETQAQDRAALLQAGQGFAELAGGQDLAQYQANLAAQNAEFANRLQAAQFAQQQYGQMGEEAFRAAQAEEEAQQAARQFDLAAMGQTGQLSLELQRLLGQQDIARAELTGRLGEGATAQDTLAARQANIQERQLAFQNAARLSEQSGIQYTVDDRGNVVPLRDAQGNPVKTSDETRAAEAIKLQQAGITGLFGEGAGQRLTQEALQTAYARAAQLTQETGIRHTVNPTTGEITAATGTGRESLEAQLRQAGITGTFGGALTQDALQNAYARAAQLSQITGQQYTVNPQTGAITLATGAGGAAVDTLAAQLQRAGLTGQLGGQATLERLQQNLQQAQILSQITGKQYTVNAEGQLVEAGAAGAQTEAARQFDLEQQLRRQLGLTEASGYIYDMLQGQLTRTTQETVQGQIARSQTLLALANALKDLTPEQIANLLGSRTGTTSPTGGGVTTTQSSGVTTTQSGASDWSTSLGPTSWGAGTTGERRLWNGKTWEFNGQTWVDTTQSTGPTTTTAAGQVTTTTSGSQFTTTTAGQVTTTAGPTTTTAGQTTTTAGQTTTTAAPTTTTASQTTTTQSGNVTTASQTVSGLLTSLYPYAFNGMYKDLGTSAGTTWYQYQNGQWVVTTQPSTISVKDPSNTFNVNAYPGMTMSDGTGRNYYWNATSWVPV